jgi:S-adenosylhomocysteine hydrolase
VAYVAPQQTPSWYDAAEVKRRPWDARLLGWHFLDGTAKAHGLEAQFANADVDIASLFALKSTRGTLSKEDLAVLSHPVPAPVMGHMDGALLTRLSLSAAKRALQSLVDDDVVADFLTSHPGTNVHMNVADGSHFDKAVEGELAFMLRARGLYAAAHKAIKRGVPPDPKDDELRAIVRNDLIDTIIVSLDRDYPSCGVIDIDKVGRTYREDACRLVRLLLSHARTQARAGPLPTKKFLDEAAAAPTGQRVRRTLAEGLLSLSAAKTPSVAGFMVQQRQAKPDAFVVALLREVEDLPSWRRREVDAAVAEGLHHIFARHTKGNVVDVEAMAAATSATAIDVAQALQQEHSPVAAYTAGSWSDPSTRALTHALEALEPPPHPRAAMIHQREDAAERFDEWVAQTNGGGWSPFLAVEPSPDEQLAITRGTKVSLATFAALVTQRAPAIMDLLPLVRVRDVQGLVAATRSFPSLQDQPRAHRFLAALEQQLDARGGTTSLDAASFPAAIIEVLATLADEHGDVSWRDVRAQYGSTVATWFALVAESVHAGVFEVNPLHALSHHPSGLSEGAVAAVGRGLPDITHVARMGGLSAIVKAHDPQTLAGFQVVLMQHLFPSTLGLIDGLLSLGLPRDQLHVLGKSYSTHERTYAALKGSDIDVDASARQDNDIAQDAGERLVEAARRTLQAMFKQVGSAERDNKASKPRFILFDEGGKLLEVLHRDFAAYAHLCVGVEHTDRGMQLLDDMEKKGQSLALPVVDMARSTAKKSFESPAIGESVVFHMHELLRELGLQPTRKQAAVIGYGAVGKATADALRRRGFDVFVHDHSESALARARQDGCVVPAGNEEARRNEVLRHAHVLISATGRTTIEPREYAALLPDGAILVNAASGTHELGVGALGDDALTNATQAEGLREDGTATIRFRGDVLSTGSYATSSKHRHLVFAADHNGVHKEQLVLRGGAVVNMTLGMPPEVVQLTLGLVASSIAQAASIAKGPRVSPARIALDPTRQQQLVDAVQQDLQQKGLPPLEQPDFRAFQAWA